MLVYRRFVGVGLTGFINEPCEILRDSMVHKDWAVIRILSNGDVIPVHKGCLHTI